MYEFHFPFQWRHPISFGVVAHRTPRRVAGGERAGAGVGGAGQGAAGRLHQHLHRQPRGGGPAGAGGVSPCPPLRTVRAPCSVGPAGFHV